MPKATKNSKPNKSLTSTTRKATNRKSDQLLSMWNQEERAALSMMDAFIAHRIVFPDAGPASGTGIVDREIERIRRRARGDRDNFTRRLNQFFGTVLFVVGPIVGFGNVAAARQWRAAFDRDTENYLRAEQQRAAVRAEKAAGKSDAAAPARAGGAS